MICELSAPRDRWDLLGDAVGSVETDPRTRETRVQVGDHAWVVVRGTRAVRCPRPLPTGRRAEIVNVSRITTDDSGILTLALRSGDTVQVAGSGLLLLGA